MSKVRQTVSKIRTHNSLSTFPPNGKYLKLTIDIYRCRINIIIAAAVCAILALAIALCNCTVLGVLLTNQKLQNAQVVYRISLGFSDLLVGILVFPSFIYNMFSYLLQKPAFEETNNGFNVTASASSFNGSSVVEESHRKVAIFLPDSYLYVIGFFTSITIFASVNTLAVAAIDRFVALCCPLKYRILATISIARGASVGIWLTAVSVAILPFWLDDLMYVTEHTSLVFAEGDLAIYTYLLTFCVPLIVMWCFTISSYIAYKKHFNTRIKLISNGLIKREMLKHFKLMITLGIMAGAFTLTMIPSIALISHLFLGDEEFFELLSLSRQNPVNYFRAAEVSVTILYLANSLTNFFIYSARDIRFRKASKTFYLKMFGKMISEVSVRRTRSTDRTSYR